MKFLNKRMVAVINHMAIGITGGNPPIGVNIREGCNLGFVDMIYSNSLFGEEIYPDIEHRAAAYMFYIIKNHVFHDGNKRTGLAAAVTFLEWNGYVFDQLEEDAAFDFVDSLAGGENDPDAMIGRIAEWLRANGKQVA